MATPTMSPAGWYTDPTGRHESRFWDSAHWTAQVADAGVTAVETTVAPMPAPPVMPPVLPMPPQAMGQFPPQVVAAAPATGYRAVAVAAWRVAMVRLGFVSLGLAFFFEIFASVGLGRLVNDATHSISPPSRSSFAWTAWLFHYGSTGITYTYPPLLLWPAMFVGYLVVSGVFVTKVAALTRAGCRARWVWSAPEERKRLGAALRASGCGQTLLRARGRMALVVSGEVAALVAAAIAGYAVSAREGLLQKSSGLTYTGDLSVGLGPKVCLVAALITVITLPLAWPQRSDRTVVVRPDGNLIDAS